MKALFSDAGSLLLAFVTLGVCTTALIGFVYNKVKKNKTKAEDVEPR